MAKLTLADARKIMQRGRPWTFRLEFHDPQANSHKYWLATGRGRNEPVEVHYGRIGSKPTIIVKDWTYLESKTPSKVAKGYHYVNTGFVRVRQATIDAFNAAQAAPGTASPPPQPSTPAKTAKPVQAAPAAPVAAQGNIPSEWDCRVGGVKVSLLSHCVRIVFDTFTAPWQQPGDYHTFKSTLEVLAKTFLGHTVKVWWGGDNSEVFEINASSRPLFTLVVSWLQKQIPGKTTPLMPPPKLTGPFASIMYLRKEPYGWQALDEWGDKVTVLTARGARDLMGQYDHIQIVGL